MNDEWQLDEWWITVKLMVNYSLMNDELQLNEWWITVKWMLNHS